MRRVIPLLLALLLLTACGAKPETVMDVLEVPAFSLPETAEAEPISAEAAVTEGRVPAENYDLPIPREFSPENRWMRYDIDGWLRGGTIGLLPEEHAIQLLGAVDLGKATNYVADYTADVGYRDGVFTLSEFHLQ